MKGIIVWMMLFMAFLFVSIWGTKGINPNEYWTVLVLYIPIAVAFIAGIIEGLE